MHQSTDVLILGSGIAGCTTAIRLAAKGFRVQLHAKSSLSDTATSWAQGGIASVFDETDSFDLHVQDTLGAGAGLCDEHIVRLVVKEGPEAVRWLIDKGVEFTKNAQGSGPDLHLEGGHSRARILHWKDITGDAIQRALVSQVRSDARIKWIEHSTAIDLIVADGRAAGAAFVDREGYVQFVTARAVILATGGAAKVYRYCTNPEVCSGDGIGMAARAGVPVANMEFMQFHPTCLYDSKMKNFLITEAIRGRGAYLVNQAGERFIDHPMQELAPRDIVAAAIDAEIKKSGQPYVYLDARHLGPKVDHEFPTISHRLASIGLALSKDLIPVVPAAHYTCGGVMVDDWGRTELPGLYAVGEVAYTGLHGANRLASNSLLEAAVFADRICQKIPEEAPGVAPRLACRLSVGSAPGDRVFISHFWNEIQTVMWNGVGIRRSATRLKWAQFRLLQIEVELQALLVTIRWDRDVAELRNLLVVSLMIVESALRRRESRGLHIREDFTESSAEWVRPTQLRVRELPKNLAMLQGQLTRLSVVTCA